MEQHFGVIRDIPFRDALLRYAEAKKRENPDGYKGSHQYQLQMILDNFGAFVLMEIDAKLLREFAGKRRVTVK